jgi:excisionase family DNA binding protein
MGDETMSIQEAADALKVSRGMIYRMVRDGRLKARTIDYRKRGRYLVLRDSLNALLAGQPPAD